MGFEELVTKQDLKAVEDKILNKIQKHDEEVKIPKVVLTDKAMQIMGDVSDRFLHALRMEGKLNPRKQGKLWLWNVKELVSLLPQDPE